MTLREPTLLNDVVRAIAFLSQIPVPGRVFAGPDRSASAISRVFAAAGVLIALPSALIAALALLAGASPLLAAVIALAVLAVTTGLLHEDGLADVADGFFGGRDPQARMDIMKDSRNGTFGTSAIVLAFLLRTAALAACLEAGPLQAVAAMIAAASASRAAMVWHWQVLPAARPDGLAGRSGRPDVVSVYANATVCAAILITLALIWGKWLAMILIVPLAVVVAAWMSTALARRMIGGHTGDTIGATQQLCEVFALCALAFSV